MKPIPLAPENVKKILVCQLRQIGDVILTTPSIELLARRFPGAEIQVFTEKRCEPMLRGNPHISKIWGLDKKSFKHFGQQLAYYWRAARQGFDLVVDFQQLPRCRWVVAFSRAKVRLSFTPPWYNRWLYTHVQEPIGGYSAMSRASILKPLGIEWQGERPRLYLAPEEKTWAEEYLRAAGLEPGQTLVCVDPSHRRATRRWPAEYYGKLISLAARERADLKFLLLYGPGELPVVQEVLDHCDARDHCMVPADMLDLRQMAACVARADLLLGNCSAPRHVAVAVDTPSLVLRGSTSPAWTYPAPEHKDLGLDLDCAPCNMNNCADPKCLTGLTPKTVLPVLLEQLELSVAIKSGAMA